MSQQQSFTINLVSNASMSTLPDNTLTKFTTLLPQSLVFHGTWEVALVELSWPVLIENVTEGLFSYQLNRDEQNRHTTTQETIVERPRFGNGMVSMYVLSNLLKRNSSTLEEEFSPEKYFSMTKGCYSSVNSILQSMCDICSSVGWDNSQFPLSWDICEASQLLHLKFSRTSIKENNTTWWQQKAANVHQKSMASSDKVFNSFINHCSSKWSRPFHSFFESRKNKLDFAI